MKNKREENVLIAINACTKIISLFLGPFLIAYFIKISLNSMFYLSIYNIYNFVVLGISGLVIGIIIKKSFKIGMFRLGIILNFIYILAILLLRENILNHLFLISLLYGVSQGSYWLPLNIFISVKIANNNRTSYEVKKKLISTIISVVAPLFLGTIITTVNYQLAAILMLVISLIQIILSFFITSLPESDEHFRLFKVFKELIRNSEYRKMMMIEFLKGTNLSDGSLGIIVTVLIFNSFKTDLNLGVITSITSIITILGSYLYGRLYKNNRNDSKIIIISALIPVLSMLLLLFKTTNETLLIYNFCYVVFTNLLALIIDIRLFNISNSKIINKNYTEFWVIRELVLNMGRIFSFILLLIVCMINNLLYLNYLLILLTLTILVMGIITIKTKNYS